MKPLSAKRWTNPLSLELDVKRPSGITTAILIPCNHGERFVHEQIGVDTPAVVTMRNFVGYMLAEEVRLGFCQIVMVGQPGILIKIAPGNFHSHSHIANARMERLVEHLPLPSALLE